jgi:hypothetical protein
MDNLPRFNGSDYDHERDGPRLATQLERVYHLMKDSKVRTLEQISKATGDPQASVSAQLRHLRKTRFGGHSVLKEHLGNGLFTYQLVLNEEG